eukprot:CAMPEP_0201585912 /NCGR_PEP_ID=MMETSP0190_2-20130828/126886_1 /ASSEMBLY_ACC=CAM_ASM_000263 /TAXON_ID=37353 /ORGANISM="Rosalina sp." /LENGTH=64 /DNA_ID=CAMNT_0048032759 /DNA_START=14 /DNA_END=208 /DNA_ORIENTATION=+
MGHDLVIDSCCGTEVDVMTGDMEKVLKNQRQDKSVMIPSSDEKIIEKENSYEYDDIDKSDQIEK